MASTEWPQPSGMKIDLISIDINRNRAAAKTKIIAHRPAPSQSMPGDRAARRSG